MSAGPWIRTPHFNSAHQSVAEGIATLSDPYERKALQLCHAWMSGQEIFSFQTSGSTGEPRAIQFTRDQIKASAMITQQALQLQHGYTALCCLDISLVAGAMMVFRSLVTGMNLLIVSPSAHPLRSNQEKIDFAAFVPYQLEQILDADPLALDMIKVIIVGGAPIKEDLVRPLSGCKSEVLATYGMTETLTHVALRKISGPHPSPDFTMIDAFSYTTDARGCLVIRAPHLPEPIVTNDLVEFTGPHTFRWMGRADFVINSGGIKFSPEVLEQNIAAALVQLFIERRFVVIGIRDPRFGESPLLVMEGKPLNNEQQLLERLLTLDPRKGRITSIQYLDKFPETASQKIDRRKISELVKVS